MGRMLEGKSILITGGSMGIGYAIAEACLEAGARIFLCSRHQADLDRAVRELDGASGRAGAWRADVSVRADVDRLFEAAVHHCGSLDGVIHCAGVYGPIGPAIDVDPDEWFAAIRINLFGTFVVARRACQELARRSGGRIVLMSGGGAAGPFPNFTSYACAKAGVVRLTETLAQEVAKDNIEINCISPGFVMTRLHQQTVAAGEKAGADFLAKTLAQIESGGTPVKHTAEAAVFLMSDLAKGITGRFVAAPYDGWAEWPRHLKELASSDIFTLRRIMPKDRGMDWQ